MQKRNILLCGGAALAIVVTGIALTSGGSADAQGPAGCYGGALNCDDDKPKVQPKAASAPKAASPDNGFAGEWTGRGDGASTFAAIKTTSSANRYAIELVATNDGGCGGGMEGVGTARGNVLALTLPLPERGEQCTMTFTKTGNRMTVDQGSGCSYFFGRSCGAGGTLTRKSAPGVPTKPVGQAAAQTPTSGWLVGSWVGQGSYCASGEAFTFKSDGTFFIGHNTDGTWRLGGGKLNLVFTMSEVDEEPGPVQRKSPSIVKVSQNDLTLGGDRMKRCPPNGGIEPWHPKARFGVR